MKIIGSIFCIIALLSNPTAALPDTLVFPNDSTVSGIVVQTNSETILLLTEDAAYNYSKSGLKEIKIESLPSSKSGDDNKLPSFQNAVLLLSKQGWATNLTPIPATVIDKGVLKNIPYSSFHCGEDYEINIYGDLEHPAGVEVGIYRKLIGNPNSETNCLKFISDLFNDTSIKDFIWNLNRKTDYKVHDDLTYEITPPTESDSYGGWWVSVYAEQDLDRARASDEEMKHITVTQKDALDQSANTNNTSGWSANDLKSARISPPKTITFVNQSGIVISNAEVVRVIDGVSLIYRNGPTSGGMVRLADLPEDLRNEFGYDAAKTAAADEAAKEDKAKRQQQLVAAQQAAQVQQAQISTPDYSGYYSGGYSSGGYSGGGSVYVHGYTRRDGTYVHSYSRR
jgi:hypothetical protein